MNTIACRTCGHHTLVIRGAGGLYIATAHGTCASTLVVRPSTAPRQTRRQRQRAHRGLW